MEAYRGAESHSHQPINHHGVAKACQPHCMQKLAVRQGFLCRHAANKAWPCYSLYEASRVMPCNVRHEHVIPPKTKMHKAGKCPNVPLPLPLLHWMEDGGRRREGQAGKGRGGRWAEEREEIFPQGGGGGK